MELWLVELWLVELWLVELEGRLLTAFWVALVLFWPESNQKTGRPASKTDTNDVFEATLLCQVSLDS